jgi:hypothetical protein
MRCIEKQLAVDPEELEKRYAAEKHHASDDGGYEEASDSDGGPDIDWDAVDDDCDVVSVAATTSTAAANPLNRDEDSQLSTQFSRTSFNTSGWESSNQFVNSAAAQSQNSMQTLNTSDGGGVRLPGMGARNLVSPLIAAQSRASTPASGVDWQDAPVSRARKAAGVTGAATPTTPSSTSGMQRFDPNCYGNPIHGSSYAESVASTTATSKTTTTVKANTGSTNFAKIRADRPSVQYPDSETDEDVREKRKGPSRPPIDWHSESEEDDDDDSD